MNNNTKNKVMYFFAGAISTAVVVLVADSIYRIFMSGWCQANGLDTCVIWMFNTVVIP